MTETDPENTPLTPLSEDGVERVLCVVAHPDDMEYGASAAVAAWTGAGVEVSYLLLTGGEAGMADPPAVIGPLRAEEQRRACEIVGVTSLTMLEHPDGMLMPSLALRRDIARQVRRLRPQLVITANFDLEAYGGLNQSDHRTAGLAAVDAARDAANPWVHRELLDDEGLEPWQASSLLVTGHPDANRAKPVGAGQVEAAVASLRAHAAYLEHVSDHPAPEQFIPAILREGGEAAGTEFAVVFRAYDL